MKRSIDPIRGGGTRFRLNKKLMSATLGVTLALGMNTIALAEEQEPNKVYHNITSEGESITTGKTELAIETIEFQEQSYLIATVPLELFVIADTQGNITVPDNLEIINNSDKAIRITETTVTANNNYGMLTANNVLNSSAKAFYIKMNGVLLTGDTSINHNSYKEELPKSDDFLIASKSTLPLDFEIGVAKLATAKVHEKLSFGTLEYTIAFDE